MAKVKRQTHGSVEGLQLHGSFFGDDETDELMRQFNELVAADNKHLVLDLSKCEAMNSLAISVLMRAHANYSKRGGEIKITGLDKRLKHTFVITRLTMVFDHHETVDLALEAFRQNV